MRKMYKFIQLIGPTFKIGTEKLDETCRNISMKNI